MKRILILLLIVFCFGCVGKPKGITSCITNKFNCDKDIKELRRDYTKYEALVKKWGDDRDMLANGNAIESNNDDLKAQIKKQFGKDIYQLGMQRIFNKQKDIFFFPISNASIRPKKQFILELLEFSPQDKWKSSNVTGTGKFICGDFSLGVSCEWNNSPWSEMQGGVAFVDGHILDWVRIMEDDFIYLIDALQQDKMWIPVQDKYIPWTLVK